MKRILFLFIFLCSCKHTFSESAIKDNKDKSRLEKINYKNEKVIIVFEDIDIGNFVDKEKTQEFFMKVQLVFRHARYVSDDFGGGYQFIDDPIKMGKKFTKNFVIQNPISGKSYKVKRAVSFDGNEIMAIINKLKKESKDDVEVFHSFEVTVEEDDTFGNTRLGEITITEERIKQTIAAKDSKTTFKAYSYPYWSAWERKHKDANSIINLSLQVSKIQD